MEKPVYVKATKATDILPDLYVKLEDMDKFMNSEHFHQYLREAKNSTTE